MGSRKRGKRRTPPRRKPREYGAPAFAKKEKGREVAGREKIKLLLESRRLAKKAGRVPRLPKSAERRVVQARIAYSADVYRLDTEHPADADLAKRIHYKSAVKAEARRWQARRFKLAKDKKGRTLKDKTGRPLYRVRAGRVGAGRFRTTAQVTKSMSAHRLREQERLFVKAMGGTLKEARKLRKRKPKEFEGLLSHREKETDPWVAARKGLGQFYDSSRKTWRVVPKDMVKAHKQGLSKRDYYARTRRERAEL